MGEAHAYGASFGCLSRRLFILWTCVVLSVLCYVQLFLWALRSHLWDAIIGNPWEVKNEADCVGTNCYEVLSCFGLKDASFHLREPLTTLAGAIFFPIGLHGAHHVYRSQLQTLAVFLVCSTALHFVVFLGDLAYCQVCGAYPSNMIYHSVLAWLPPSPVTNAAQASLSKLSVFSYEQVATITENFAVAPWYNSMTTLLVLFLAYAAHEAVALGHFAERGPLGLGMHYGLGKWDEYLDHDAVRRLKNKSVRSKFIDDATLPGADYGSTKFGQAPVPLLKQDGDDDYDDEETA
mmetsp:Transcript_64432/g.135201  ORF Transcript_64432/g.135201 Transcript_64432/m.135201 type:complete len:292 (+) Transcript_64432:171-1046(+)|eukprot:CAMPEP_0206423960 /NCGR_PEP_ID=MMETSP0324_2-20121206/2959_1 /ASSEMBLY_ACC=CAM_ASM_000836 /TAXON_ID=2866 /ORGANISM="Crypthecodinium cohnii, Strain Seligo" /LENGTH=291 /DNA_ID=CAMNT_0053888555 /DNA_START=114 /DNA_END=989 /DNA_ORIENTATION=-